MEGSYWVGLDVGYDVTTVAAVDQAGTALLEVACRTDAREIAAALAGIRDQPPVLIAAEAGVGTNLIRQLRAMGLAVTVFEARKVSRFLEVNRIKSDVTDARGLADLARVGRSVVSEVYVKSPECENLRTQLAMRHRLTVHCLAIEAMLKSLVKVHGGRLPLGRRKGAYPYAVNREMRRLVDAGINTDEVVRPVLAIREAMRDHLAAVDKRLEKKAREHEVCRRLMTVPGVGWITALSFYTAIEDPHRFSNVAAVGPYFGLTPRLRQSGQMLHRGRISRMGSPLTRTHLVLAAATLIVHNRTECPLRDWAVQLHKRIGGAKARVAVARKLAVVMLKLWKAGVDFDPTVGARAADPHTAPPPGRQARTSLGCIEESVSSPRDMRPSLQPGGDRIVVQTIDIEEARRRFPKVLKAVKAGTRFTVMRDDRPIARIEAVESLERPPEEIDRLLAFVAGLPRRHMPAYERQALYN